jgi:hypothetical protein
MMNVDCGIPKSEFQNPQLEYPLIPSVVRPTLLYISSEAVIPAEAGIQFRNVGFRVKPGMTIKVKGLLTQYTTILECF